MSDECFSGGVNDCENGDGDERKEEGRRMNLETERVNTKTMKILKVLSVLVIVMAQGVKRGEKGGEGSGGAFDGSLCKVEPKKRGAHI